MGAYESDPTPSQSKLRGDALATGRRELISRDPGTAAEPATADSDGTESDKKKSPEDGYFGLTEFGASGSQKFQISKMSNIFFK